MQDEKHESGESMPEKRPAARERYAQERKVLLKAGKQGYSDDPLVDAQLKYDLLPMGHDL